MTVPISQLFVPLPSGVVNGVTPTTAAPGTWIYNEIQNGNALSLPVTSWQSGGVAWTEMLVSAVGMAVSDATISIHAQAAFLDYCATGTVAFPDPSNPNASTITVPVTPDPSIPAQNPNGQLGWLDVLADNYAVTRNLATYASGSILLVNTTGSSLGSFAVGTFRALNGFTGSTYKNSSAFTCSASTIIGTSVTIATATAPVVVTTSSAHGIAADTTLYFAGIGVLLGGYYLAHPTGPTTLSLTGTAGVGSYSGTTGRVYSPASIPIVADLIGPGSNAAPGQINAPVSALPGVVVANPLAAAGSPYESNVALAARCRAKLGSLSLNGPAGAYNYYALTSSQILAAQSPPKTLVNAITREADTNSLATGTVSVVVANDAGPVPGAAQLAVTGATGSGVTPIVLTVPSTANVSTGMVGLVMGVTGNVAANGYFTLTVVDGTHVSLQGSIGSGTYTGGGLIEAGDLGLVDSVIQAYARPNAVSVATVSAVALNVIASATVYVPVAFLADYGTNPVTNKGAVALQGYFPGLPIGGVTGVDGAGTGVIPMAQIIELLMQSGTTGGRQYTVSVSNVILNTASQDLPVSSSQVAVLIGWAVQVVGA